MRVCPSGRQAVKKMRVAMEIHVERS